MRTLSLPNARDWPDYELFPVGSWLHVLMGQKFFPKGYDPMADRLSLDQAQAALDDILRVMEGASDAMPRHGDFIRRNCAANA